MSSKQVDSCRFLVDVNLPKKFRFFNTDGFLHVADIDASMTDELIWNYALEHDLTILTKDTDFYDLFFLQEKFPKIIHFKIGNLTLKEMHDYFEKFWPAITTALNSASFIVAYNDRITVIR